MDKNELFDLKVKIKRLELTLKVIQDRVESMLMENTKADDADFLKDRLQVVKKYVEAMKMRVSD